MSRAIRLTLAAIAVTALAPIGAAHASNGPIVPWSCTWEPFLTTTDNLPPVTIYRPYCYG